MLEVPLVCAVDGCTRMAGAGGFDVGIRIRRRAEYWSVDGGGAIKPCQNKPAVPSPSAELSAGAGSTDEPGCILRLPRACVAFSLNFRVERKDLRI